MKKTIKPQWALLSLAAFAMLASAPSSHADGFVAGKVELVRVFDAQLFPGWGPPASTFWFSLTGVTTLGSCQAWASGKIPFVSQNKEQLALVLSAQLADKQISVYYTDSQTVSGYCRAGIITPGDPPPAGF